MNNFIIPVINEHSRAKAELEISKRSGLSVEDKQLLDQIKENLKANNKNSTYLDKKGVAALLGVSTKTVERMDKKAILPAPKNIPLSDLDRGTRGRKLLRWRKKEVIEFIDSY